MRQLFKIVVIGDGGVGKTTTIHNIFHYLNKKFPSCTYKSCQDDLKGDNRIIERTKFIDFHTITFNFSNQKIVWQIWDLQGQRFPSSHTYTSLNPLDHITETVIKNADLILLTYDASANATFNELFREGGFYDLIKPFLLDQQEILLLASKTDLLEKQTRDPIIKLEIEHEFEKILYNNTYLENISIIGETLLNKLHFESNELYYTVSDTKKQVTLKVFK